MNTAVFLIRRILFVAALLQPTFITKFACLIILSILQMGYYLRVKPHTRKSVHYLELFNEGVLLASIYFLPLFTEYAGSVHDRFVIGWVFAVGIIFPLFIGNMSHTFLYSVREAYAELRNVCTKK
jgi:hypothetical protein